jgi:hypothetical protein
VLVIRRVGALILMAATIAVWVLMAPEDPGVPEAQTQETVRDRAGEIRTALSDAETNEVFADSAPQQQVVNGWAARDLLAIIAQQQNEALTREEVPAPVPPLVPNDERIPALAGLLVVGLGLGLITTPRPDAPTTTVPSDPVPSTMSGQPSVAGSTSRPD